jgi:predicted Zn-dependent protease
LSPTIRGLSTALALTALLVACAKVPFTNRAQFNLIPNDLMRGIGKSQYTSMLKGQKLDDGKNKDVLMRVGKRISKVANQPKFDWKFNLIKDKQVNAWCLPGGYIAFYTGILPALENEAGMSFVMGHEVGHAVANHGAERMSQSLAILGGLAGLAVVVNTQTEMKPEHQAILLGALGAGATVGIILPFSRAHESEADVIGMMYMAQAGYPPAESIKVWQRMAKESPSSMPPFLSTHPSHEKRQENLREWLEGGKKKYQRSKKAANATDPLWD